MGGGDVLAPFYALSCLGRTQLPGAGKTKKYRALSTRYLFCLDILLWLWFGLVYGMDDMSCSVIASAS